MANTVNYTVTLTNTEDMALSYAAVKQQDWIDNAIHNRCRIAINDIVALTVQKCLQQTVQIPQTEDDIVALAFNKGWVQAAANNVQVTANT